MIRINSHPNMSTAVYHGHIATHQIDKICMVWPFSAVVLSILSLNNVCLCDFVCIVIPHNLFELCLSANIMGPVQTAPLWSFGNILIRVHSVLPYDQNKSEVYLDTIQFQDKILTGWCLILYESVKFNIYWCLKKLLFPNNLKFLNCFPYILYTKANKVRT